MHDVGYVWGNVTFMGRNKMDLNNLSLNSLAAQKMQYLTERQKVLATNVANANTPGYLPKDLKEPDFASVLQQNLPMAVTNSKHIGGIGADMKGRLYTPKPATALTIDGNGVVIEDQLNEISKDKGEYERLITIYNKYRTMIKMANTKISS